MFRWLHFALLQQLSIIGKFLWTNNQRYDPFYYLDGSDVITNCWFSSVNLIILKENNDVFFNFYCFTYDRHWLLTLAF